MAGRSNRYGEAEEEKMLGVTRYKKSERLSSLIEVYKQQALLVLDDEEQPDLTNKATDHQQKGQEEKR